MIIAGTGCSKENHSSSNSASTLSEKENLSQKPKVEKTEKASTTQGVDQKSKPNPLGLDEAKQAA